MDATFMTALHIRNVRHLKNIQIPLSQEERKSLILTGKNGSGKTSVLIALEKFLEYAVSSSFCSQEQCKSSIAHYENLLVQKSLTENDKIKIEQNRKHLTFWKDHLAFWTDDSVAEYSSYADLRAKYQNGNYILAYYGDRREIKVNISDTIEKVDLKNVYTLTDHPSRELVKYLVNLKTTEAFAQTSGNTQRAAEIKNWFSRFEEILRSIYDDDSLTLDFNIDTFKFTIHQKNREPFDFNTMSMGYAAVFDIIGDLIMRMEAQRRYDIEGLVLIDEIESHLHVELQKKIVPILMKLFPNIQFILTTHSPFILNSTPNAVVYDLENSTLVKDGLTNLPYEGIVEGYFGVDLLSQELRKKFVMIKIARSPAAPASLAVEKAKGTNNYRGEDVIRQLYTDFHGKCYLCEIDNLQSIEVEHLKAHHNGKNRDLMFDWNNLFYSCSHCNSVKNMIQYEDCILDCCRIDPELYLNQGLINGHVKVQALDTSHSAQMTAQLITECFEKKQYRHSHL